MDMPKIKIKAPDLDGAGGVYAEINGVAVPGIQKVSVNLEHGCFAEVIMTFDAEIDVSELTAIPEMLVDKKVQSGEFDAVTAEILPLCGGSILPVEVVEKLSKSLPGEIVVTNIAGNTFDSNKLSKTINETGNKLAEIIRQRKERNLI